MSSPIQITLFMRWIFTIWILLLLTVCYAQKHDNIWVIGYRSLSPDGVVYDGTIIDFSISPPFIYGHERNLDFLDTNANICDEEGNLLFYSNGGAIVDSSHNIMENGEELNPSSYHDEFFEVGYRFAQGAILLLFEGNDSIFYLFHPKAEFAVDGWPSLIRGLFYSKINKNGNGGLGTVIEKSQLILDDTLTSGKVVATKHANGRDWWVVVPEYDSFNHYVMLVAPDTVIVHETGNLEPNITNLDLSVGFAGFSPDGTKYARHDLRLLPEGNSLNIYDFNRCTGELSNNIEIEMNDTTAIRGGVIFSQNSRFLYALATERIYQFDLWAIDIEASRTIVAEYDGFLSLFGFGTRFNSAQLAPDGKIYVTTAGTDNILHRINLPNHLGVDCDVEQHAITLPTINGRSLPNFPNFRLGAIDGSPCDTLGLDNHPLAGFTWETDGLTAIFSDNSYYNPSDWSWDFGDTGTDSDPNPIHTFAEEGIYVVCLTVTNDNSSDTICQEVTVSTLKADFSFETDELEVNFMDASLSNPLEWSWDFGDNMTSDVANPNHNYLAEGDYEVCLTIIDEWASDTHCDSVRVMVIDGVLEQEHIEVEVFPNPTTNEVTVILENTLENGTIYITDITGKEVIRTSINKNKETIDISSLPQGMYWLNILDGEVNIFTEKLIVIK